MSRCCLAVFASLIATCEIIDRVAVTVDQSVITMSEIMTQLRVAALVDDKPLKLDEGSLREAADRLIQQTIVRREITFADYPAPTPDATEKALADLKRDRFGNQDAQYRAALQKYGVPEESLKDQVRWQLMLLRFVEMRFRPAVQVAPEDIREYYRQTFVPEWKKRTSAPVPTLPQSREQIEAILTQERIDSTLDRWLNQTRTQLRIVYRDAAFKEAAKP